MGIVSVILGLSYLARWEQRYQDAVRLAGAAESSVSRSAAGLPSNSSPASSATRIPRRAPISLWTPPNGPGTRAGP